MWWKGDHLHGREVVVRTPLPPHEDESGEGAGEVCRSGAWIGQDMKGWTSMENVEIDWVVDKASELLADKIEEGPLTEEDINLAFEMFAKPRLRKMSDSFSGEEEYTEAENEVRVRLHEVANKLNEENWSE
ncbi:hypothetical protein AKJ37_05235 [candidate division MSBL1 archaeon SCGC-AAA259I09]|uniref:Uncharacterized protein n=2 Tax=candidate division MSBL1 TaxID=215777 RepID=A0A133UQB6_9EURY|nr:hypothetical protein AKJ66_02110 [candidate division MSBL1 archaeon SCGC-AAA259E22]KXA96452.1 hypothetical protein AKJ37_05235 [candidate division MSBL1 archaeon SCGC-AAA259I09]